MGVMAIWRYPVKAMLGELLDRAATGSREPAGITTSPPCTC
jgi:uncharacterized protein YcbX